METPSLLLLLLAPTPKTLDVLPVFYYFLHTILYLWRKEHLLRDSEKSSYVKQMGHYLQWSLHLHIVPYILRCRAMSCDVNITLPISCDVATFVTPIVIFYCIFETSSPCLRRFKAIFGRYLIVRYLGDPAIQNIDQISPHGMVRTIE
jgi:hypothetical protein